MKTRLLIILGLAMFTVNAQTTHQIFWKVGVNGAAASKTIEVGDTVEWIWDDALPHTVSSKAGSAEAFNSGSITGMGLTYSKTFNVIGTNDYQCNVHPATMFGTITVQNGLSTDDPNLAKFRMYPNPSNSILNLKLPQQTSRGNVLIFDALGKKFVNKAFDGTNPIELDISNWIQGIYYVKVISGENTQTKQFIKN